MNIHHTLEFWEELFDMESAFQVRMKNGFFLDENRKALLLAVLDDYDVSKKEVKYALKQGWVQHTTFPSAPRTLNPEMKDGHLQVKAVNRPALVLLTKCTGQQVWLKRMISYLVGRGGR